MKHKSLQKLKYDGSIEEYLKQKSIVKENTEVYKNYEERVGKFAEHLAKKFKDVKNVYFIEIAKIAIEIYMKKQRDELILENTSNINQDYSGSIELMAYLSGLKSNTIHTHEIVINFSDPNFNGIGKMKKNKFVLDGRALIKFFEQLFLKEYLNTEFIKSFPKKTTKVKLFGRNYSKTDQFLKQYAKVACNEITDYLKKCSVQEKELKSIVIYTLENLRFIEQYKEYVKRMELKKENDFIEIDTYSLWVSRTYRSIIR